MYTYTLFDDTRYDQAIRELLGALEDPDKVVEQLVLHEFNDFTWANIDPDELSGAALAVDYYILDITQLPDPKDRARHRQRVVINNLPTKTATLIVVGDDSGLIVEINHPKVVVLNQLGQLAGKIENLLMINKSCWVQDLVVERGLILTTKLSIGLFASLGPEVTVISRLVYSPRSWPDTYVRIDEPLDRIRTSYTIRYRSLETYLAQLRPYIGALQIMSDLQEPTNCFMGETGCDRIHLGQYLHPEWNVDLFPSMVDAELWRTHNPISGLEQGVLGEVDYLVSSDPLTTGTEAEWSARHLTRDIEQFVLIYTYMPKELQELSPNILRFHDLYASIALDDNPYADVVYQDATAELNNILQTSSRMIQQPLVNSAGQVFTMMDMAGSYDPTRPDPLRPITVEALFGFPEGTVGAPIEPLGPEEMALVGDDPEASVIGEFGPPIPERSKEKTEENESASVEAPIVEEVPTATSKSTKRAKDKVRLDTRPEDKITT